MWEFASILGWHLLAALGLRQVLVERLIRNQPIQRQSTGLLLLDGALFLGTGLGITLFDWMFFDYPLVSGLEVTLGLVTVGVFAALDLSLEWEYRIIRGGGERCRSFLLTENYYPLTRKFALLATGTILFVTVILLLLLGRDVHWLMSEQDGSEALPLLLHSIIWEVLFVMGTLLVLTLTLVFSYARNLRLLFGNQTRVLEQVSRGILEYKVPVVTNDEFAVIAGHTNAMIDRLAERERLMQGLELARQIQASMLPTSSPYLPGVQVVGSSVFCDQTGGDFYDYLVRDGSDGPELVIMIGDVSGHGIGAALLMTTVRAYLKAQMIQCDNPARALTVTNGLICKDMKGNGHYVTVFLLVYSTATKLARWAGAGHDPALYWPFGSNTCAELRGKDIPLGVDAHWQFAEGRQPLDAGVLLLGTDGIWEARNVDGQMFGKSRLKELLQIHLQDAPEMMMQAVHAQLEGYCSGVDIDDDRTMVIVRLGPE